METSGTTAQRPVKSSPDGTPWERRSQPWGAHPDGLPVMTLRERALSHRDMVLQALDAFGMSRIRGQPALHILMHSEEGLSWDGMAVRANRDPVSEAVRIIGMVGGKPPGAGVACAWRQWRLSPEGVLWERECADRRVRARGMLASSPALAQNTAAMVEAWRAHSPATASVAAATLAAMPEGLPVPEASIGSLTGGVSLAWRLGPEAATARFERGYASWTLAAGGRNWPSRGGRSTADLAADIRGVLMLPGRPR